MKGLPGRWGLAAWFVIVGACITIALAGCGNPAPGGSVAGDSSSFAGETAAANAPTARTADGAGAAGGAFGPASEAAASSAETAPPAAALPRKIIYTASVNLVVRDMSEAARKLARRVREMGGYVSGANLTGSEGTPRSGSWIIRLPVSRFEAFMNGVTDFGILESSNTASQDVSEEFYDVEARLRNKRMEEARLLEHLRRSTAKLSDILAVEREISRVREEIERMEGRLRFLANQTDLTTITVSMREERDYVPARPATFMEKARTAFRDSRQALGAFLQVVALTVITLIPWLAIAALVLVPLRLVLRRSSDGSGKVISFRPRRRGVDDTAPDADRDRYD